MLKRRLIQALISIALAASTAGCQTSRSWEEGCPGPYSGVRYFGDQVGTLPFDGKIFYAIDLPLSAIADTLLLPVSFQVDPARPPGGWLPGCLWAK